MSRREMSETVLISASAEAVFRHIASWEYNAPEIKRTEILEGAPGRPATVRYHIRGLGRSVTNILRYEIDSPTLIRFDLVESNVLRTYTGEYRIEADGAESTRCTYVVAAEPRVPVPGLLMRLAERRIVDGAVRGLKLLAEGTVAM